MRSSGKIVTAASVLLAASVGLSGCGLLGGVGSPTPTAVASAAGTASGATSQASPTDGGALSGTSGSADGSGSAGPSAAASSGAPTSATGTAEASPSDRVNPNDPTGVAARLGVTLVDAGDAGMVRNGLTNFRTPSGRIRCMLSDEPDAFARCDVGDATYTPPAKPADCEFDWGSSVTVVPGKRGSFVCVSDAVDNGPVLAYGSAVIVGDLICISRSDGVTCQTVTTALHGFRIARESFRLF